MKGIYVTQVEIEALHGTGPLATCAYLWLRSWMDLRTGVVGESRPISLGMLRAYCETHVAKGQGVQIVQSSERNIRTALEGLVRVGLIHRLAGDCLVYRLAKAQLVPLVPGIPDANLTGDPDAKPDTVDNPRSAAHRLGSLRAGRPFRTPIPTSGRPPFPTHNRDQGTQPSRTSAATRNFTVGIAAADPRQEAFANLLRNEGVVVSPTHPAVMAWVEQGVTTSDLMAAVNLARQAREAEGSNQPLNVGFIQAKLKKVIGNAVQPRTPWWSSVAALEAQARKLNIPAARPGESMEDFKARIRAAQMACRQPDQVSCT